MAEAIASFALNGLANLITSEAKFLNGVKSQVERMQIELRRMDGFLKDVDATRPDRDNRATNWIVEIREVAYDAEDAVQAYVLKIASRSGRLAILRVSELRKIGSDLEAIYIRIADITRSISTYGVSVSSHVDEPNNATISSYARKKEMRRTYSHVEEEDIVGLGKEVEDLAAALVKSEKHVAILGMGGVGKTTLAKRIYRHHLIRRHFDCFAWTCISQQWQTKDVLQGLLIGFLRPNKEQREEIEKMRIEELVRKLYQFQKARRCLVILDDVWHAEAVESLSPAFPNSTGGSKILLTTRNKEVALHMRGERVLHELRFLTEAESLELFRKKAFARNEGTEFGPHRTEMEKLGRDMVRDCGGLPLAIVVIGGLLATKPIFGEWKVVHKNMKSYLRGDKGHRQQHGGVMDVLALSYEDLPYYLKICFLYLGQFPEDYEIEAEQLVRMWVAEGIVSPMTHYWYYQKEGEELEETMVDVARAYLDELVERCVVQVRLSKSRGRLKSCRLHDVMRDFCLSKTREENFCELVPFRHVNQILLGDISSTSSSTFTKIRRLGIYFDHEEDADKTCVTDGQEHIIGRHHLRTVLCFHKGSELSCIRWQQLQPFLNGLKLPRVLGFYGIRILGRDKSKILTKIGKMMNLRYLSLRRSEIVELPSSLGNLRCLQTLDLRVSRLIALYVPDVLWKMEQLRHLYFPRAKNLRTLSDSKLRLHSLSNLETLVNLDARCCDVQCMPKWKRIQELKITYIGTQDIKAVLESANIITSARSSSTLMRSSFCIKGDIVLDEEQSLLRQILGGHHLYNLHIAGTLDKLPKHYHFNSEVTKLVLAHTKLVEDPMATLEMLPQLRSLALSWDSYVGKTMVCSASRPPQDGTSQAINGSVSGFPQLKYLTLSFLHNLEEWRVDGGAMPSLLHLQIRQCDNLKAVPDGLRFVNSLEKLEIISMPEAFKNRLHEGREDYYKIQHVPSRSIITEEDHV
ncbi:hypothetical protein RJ640_020597 [Escallonia rubra]|uniref:AAA+ ATPase domain-containing protein n=1 Tax=Escallonia rubra TaxID=112253 RepID=A0AA88SDI6_9ASTE|nr:hypothetical protein RJ640_020597 [Escallonia rubra]